MKWGERAVSWMSEGHEGGDWRGTHSLFGTARGSLTKFVESISGRNILLGMVRLPEGKSECEVAFIVDQSVESRGETRTRERSQRRDALGASVLKGWSICRQVE